MEKRTHLLWIVGLVSLCFLYKTDLTQAQITSDGTLSTKIQTTNNLDFAITNGNRVGSNLFHSFRKFSVPTGGSAFFANDPVVMNIISRVTGASISNIDGQLKTNGSANLFLINPSGIIFGPNASLNMNGSFVASTASNLLFADGTQFSAINPQTPPLLTVRVPIGLQFGQTAKLIQSEGSNLQVMPGKTLALLGGDVSIKGGVLGSPEGRIELGSVAANSFVRLTPITEGWALGYDGVQKFQDLQVSQGALIATDGEGNGAIQLQGREIGITGGSAVGGTTLGEKPGQPLVIKASESVEVSGLSQQLDRSQLSTLTVGAGAASDIIIETRRLLISNGGFIDAPTLDSGLGGNVTVNASESVQLLGGGFVTSLGTRSLGLNNDAGNAGTVRISTRSLILRDGGRISTSTVGAGNGGSVRVDASESVEASGRAVVNSTNVPSGLLAEASEGSGSAGDLRINTGTLTVRDGAAVSVSSTGSGNAGNLEITANNLLLNNRGKLTAETTAGQGNINLRSGALILRRSSQITTNAQGTNVIGGNITIDTGVLAALEDSDITANSIDFRGGNVTINAQGIFGTNSRLQDTPESDITATGAISNGTVQLNTPDIDPNQGLAALPANVIDPSALIANSCIGRSNRREGKFIITGNGGLPVRPDDPPIAPYQTYQIPTVQSASVSGIREREGDLRYPSGSPTDYAAALRYRSLTTNSDNATPPTPKPLVEATGWKYGAHGEVILVTQAPTVAPDSSLSKLPTCHN